jgi:glycosyltransferase involved in cell wall biosynthesis
MRILFIHRTMPGQFGRLAASLAGDGHEVVFVTRIVEQPVEGVRAVTYAPARSPSREIHRYLVTAEAAVLNGQAVARQCFALDRAGFAPDLIVAHPGWGESLFVREVFPHARLVNYCEFFYHPSGVDAGFDPGDRLEVDDRCRIRTRNAHLLLALADCDAGICPTEWQKQVHPPEFRSKLSVVFDGIDAAQVKPDPAATFLLPDGRQLSAGDEIVTYVARHLEPYRGFPTMMRAVPEILARRPSAQIVIAGADGVAYGRAAAEGRSWREVMGAEVAIDPARVHFVGKLPYRDYLKLLQVSAAHVYLTVPFVLSWSMMEALAAGCALIGSATPPVEEVIENGRNGWLVDFFSPAEVAERVAEVLQGGAEVERVRRAARETVLERYELGRCLTRQKKILGCVPALA